jgi:hypothetical protein
MAQIIEVPNEQPKKESKPQRTPQRFYDEWGYQGERQIIRQENHEEWVKWILSQEPPEERLEDSIFAEYES